MGERPSKSLWRLRHNTGASAPISVLPSVQIARTDPCRGLKAPSVGGWGLPSTIACPFAAAWLACRMPAKPDFAVVDLPSTASAPPANLGPAGVGFWQSIVAEYDISDAGGRALLEQAACAYDRAERLRAQ